MIKEMKLKTLKEIENEKWLSKNDLGYIQAKEDIKQEVIKWVKEWKKEHDDFSRGRQNGLIIFCNITEEDLK